MKNKPIRQHVQLAPDKYSNAGMTTALALPTI